MLHNVIKIEFVSQHARGGGGGGGGGRFTPDVFLFFFFWQVDRPITGWRVEGALLVQLLSTKKARIVQIGDTRMKLSQIVKGPI